MLKSMWQLTVSTGVSATHPDNELFKRVLGDFIDWCGANGVVVVTAAGNDGDQSHFLHEFLPQKLGSQDNVLITVGGTHPDGSLWIGSRPQAAGREGSISIYAQGTDIRCSDRDGALRNEAGTSFSAAAIVSQDPVYESPLLMITVRVGGILDIFEEC